MGDSRSSGDKGRDMREAHIVNQYLEYLERRKSLGRLNDVDKLMDRLTEIDKMIPEATTGVQRIDMVQERIDLQEALEAINPEYEARFVEIAAAWAERRGVSYAALREVGVPAHVLRQAGIETS